MKELYYYAYSRRDDHLMMYDAPKYTKTDVRTSLLHDIQNVVDTNIVYKY